MINVLDQVTLAGRLVTRVDMEMVATAATHQTCLIPMHAIQRTVVWDIVPIMEWSANHLATCLACRDRIAAKIWINTCQDQMDIITIPVTIVTLMEECVRFVDHRITPDPISTTAKEHQKQADHKIAKVHEMRQERAVEVREKALHRIKQQTRVYQVAAKT